MSVLTCPVCQGAMREVNKEGILIDVCTQCRGVWLDRGELEKLSNMMQASYNAPRQAPPYEAVAGQAPYDAPRQPSPYDSPRQAPYDTRPPRPAPDDYAYRERSRDRDDDDDDRRDDDRRHRGDDRGRQSGFGRFLDFFD